MDLCGHLAPEKDWSRDRIVYGEEIGFTQASTCLALTGRKNMIGKAANESIALTK